MTLITYQLLGNLQARFGLIKLPIKINTINYLMKRKVANSFLQILNKNVTNHSANKTLVKSLELNQVPMS